MITLPRVAARIFDEPLAISRAKLDIIIAAIGPRLQGMPMDDPDEMADRAPVSIDGDGIAAIEITGTLVARCTGMAAASGLTSYAALASEFQAAIDNPSCRGVMLYCNSPGGEVAGMFELADMIYESRGQKPVCAVVNCAASAAYLLASAADLVLVSQTGITGSVGIIALHLDESGADEKAGLKYTAIYAGARKNDGNPHEPLSPEAKAGMQGRVDKIYGMFTDAVARNRGLTDADVRATQASIYMGRDGVNVGLADALGTDADARRLLTTAIQRGERSISASTFAASAAKSPKEGDSMVDPKAPAEAKVPTAAEIETMVSEARAAGFADASQIVTLCALAGTPARAAEFITARKSVADVSAALLAAKVEADEKLKLNPGLLPGAAEPKEGAQGKADPWGKVLKAIGVRTKEQN